LEAIESTEDFKQFIRLVADRFDNLIATMDKPFQYLGQIEYMGYIQKKLKIDRTFFEVSLPIYQLYHFSPSYS
jgi:hypothetical protein